MTFRVGQKVVCVDASDAPMLRLNSIYTVVGILSDPWGEGLQVNETSPAAYGDDWWTGFRAERFRPIVERKTGISIFTKMLTPEGVDA